MFTKVGKPFLPYSVNQSQWTQGLWGEQIGRIRKRTNTVQGHKKLWSERASNPVYSERHRPEATLYPAEPHARLILLAIDHNIDVYYRLVYYYKPVNLE